MADAILKIARREGPGNEVDSDDEKSTRGLPVLKLERSVLVSGLCLRVSTNMAVEGYFFTPLVLLIIPKECHDEFFIKFNFFHAACFKLALSKVLGYGIVVGSSMIKIPQIIKVAAAGSVVGLSLMSFVTELIATTVTSVYSIQKGFPFSTWGESFFLSVQTSLLVAMYFHYNRRSSMAAVFLAIYAVCIYGLLSKYVSLSILTQLFSLNVPLMAISKVLQILSNFKHGHTGQLSFIMVFLLFIGAIARIFTTVQETGDAIMLATYLKQTLIYHDCCNFIIGIEIGFDEFLYSTYSDT